MALTCSAASLSHASIVSSLAGRARQATDPIALGDVGQYVENFFNRCSAPAKQCAFRFRKGLLAGSALVALPTGLGVTKLDYVSRVVRL
jgi:hypothetical protein